MHYATDSALFSALAGRVEDINVQVMEAPLIGINYPEIVPVNTNYADWQIKGASAEYRYAGKADWLTGDSDDVPKVSLAAAQKEFGFSPYGVGYGFNMEELGLARASGVASIDTLKARAARRKSEEFAQNIAINGDARKGYQGIINLSGANVSNAATQWRSNTALTATTAQILADIAVLVDGPITSVIDPEFVRADTVALDQLTYRLLGVTQAGGLDYGQRTVRRVIEEAFPGISFVVIPELATAAATPAGGARAIGYARRSDVVELPVAFGYRFERQYDAGPFKFNVPGWGRLSGVQLHVSSGLRYLDNIGPVPA